MIIFKEIYIVNDFKTKILIDINIIISEKIDIIVSIFSIFIKSYQVKMPLEIYIKNSKRVIIYLVYARRSIIILSRFEIYILIHYIFLLDRDFFFELDQN